MDIEKKATLSLIALGVAMISPVFIAEPLSKALSYSSKKDNATLDIISEQRKTIPEPEKITTQKFPLVQQPAPTLDME